MLSCSASGIRSILLGLGLLLLGAGTSRAQDLCGAWSGHWEDCNSGHSGPLKATFCKCDDTHYRVTSCPSATLSSWRWSSRRETEFSWPARAISARFSAPLATRRKRRRRTSSRSILHANMRASSFCHAVAASKSWSRFPSFGSGTPHLRDRTGRFRHTHNLSIK
jgi:hypothetical protein